MPLLPEAYHQAPGKSMLSKYAAKARVPGGAPGLTQLSKTIPDQPTFTFLAFRSLRISEIELKEIAMTTTIPLTADCQ